MKTTAFLNDFYASGREDLRLTSRHGSVEFFTTLRYLERYLRPGMRILEIGAGTGRYTHYLAQKGYCVDAVELVDANIEIFLSHTLPGEQITIRQGNALDLSDFGDASYDIVLLLGPMYHLYTASDQKKALEEAVRVTKEQGYLFIAYCNNDATVIGHCFVKGNLQHCIEQGMIDPKDFLCRSEEKDVFQLYRKEDVDRLNIGFPLRRLHYVGTDMATNFIRDTVDQMDDATFRLYLDYHFSICEREDMVGATHHMLDVLQKQS